jgi:hypothetical protein
LIVRRAKLSRQCAASDELSIRSSWLLVRTVTQSRITRQARPLTGDFVLKFRFTDSARIMLFSKEYVGYLAREVSKKLLASGLIETKTPPALQEKVHAAMHEELALEDRINDEVRVILEAYSEELQKSGANYQEMFRKVKTELVKKYKAVL